MVSSEQVWACRNELCDRKIVGGAAYCCAACSLADEHKFEIHEHLTTCNELAALRGEFTYVERYLYVRPRW